MLLVLILLQIKHYYADFVWQTSDHIKYKGEYGHIKGIEHSLHHSGLTALIFLPFVGLELALILGLVDFVLHYHIDYVKIRYGEKNIATKDFWTHFGMDQLAHQITYVLLILIARM